MEEWPRCVPNLQISVQLFEHMILIDEILCLFSSPSSQGWESDESDEIREMNVACEA